MKRLALFFVIAFTSVLSINAQSDYELISETVNYYLDGGTNNDFQTLKKAFHSDATMKYITDEGYKEVNALDFFSSMDPNKPPQTRKTRIENITVSGHAANARLEIEYPTFIFVDFMNLLKINGEWKIVNKIFYRKPKMIISQ